jgi:hypothetical protein
MYISEADLSDTYTIPVTLLEIYFLFILIQLLQSMFKKSKAILELLPAPTKNTEAKFTSIVAKLETTGGYVFSSYTHESALFYFDFTQFKTFILFLSSLLPVIPIQSIKDNATLGISVIFIISCLFIAGYNIFYFPYKSRLHNITNTISYFIGFITSLISLLKVVKQDTSSALGTTAYLLVIIVPIVVTLVCPFFIKFDIRQRPVKYTLKDIAKKNRLIESQKKNKDDDDSESESDSSSTDQDFSTTDFNLINVSPVHITMGLDAHQKGYEPEVKRVWGTSDVNEKDLTDATEELFKAANELLDATSYNSLKTTLNLSTIFVSICFGWGLGAGIATWKTENSYLNCQVEDERYYLGTNII